jgi:hypothetical protein
MYLQTLQEQCERLGRHPFHTGMEKNEDTRKGAREKCGTDSDIHQAAVSYSDMAPPSAPPPPHKPRKIPL